PCASRSSSRRPAGRSPRRCAGCPIESTAGERSDRSGPHVTRVAHWGTFEVANLGDLLFPLVLEHHLRAANGEVEVQWVGPLGGTAPMGLERAVARALPFEHEGVLATGVAGRRLRPRRWWPGAQRRGRSRPP